MAPTRFEGFETRSVATSRGQVHLVTGGDGPPLLLVHGWPQTHLMWHGVAPPLAERFTVVAADLPGYGDSFRPVPAADHAPHSKRAFATDLVEAMAALGHERFAVAGHDRGGRVAMRMALDHPSAVSSLAVLDIVPTGRVWAEADATFALGYWHWGFLAQPAPLPERMIAGAPGEAWAAVERMGIGAIPDRYPPEIVARYRDQFGDAGVVEAMCEDYRAGATIDRELDDADLAAGRTIDCPVLALWGARGALPIFYADPLELWRPYAPAVTGRAIDASHFLAEDEPDEVAAALSARLAA